jgi:hypothetical protein
MVSMMAYASVSNPTASPFCVCEPDELMYRYTGLSGESNPMYSSSATSSSVTAGTSCARPPRNTG